MLALSVAPAADAAGVQQPKCVVGHAHVLASDHQGVVFETGWSAWGPHMEHEVRPAVWACAYGHARYRVGTPPPPESMYGYIAVSNEVLNAWTMAYEWESIRTRPEVERGSYLQFVVVRDIRTDRVLRRVPTGAPLHPEHGDAGVGFVESMVVTQSGSVAWIASDDERSFYQPKLLVCEPREPPDIPEICSYHDQPSYFDLYASDTFGTHLLASGNDIEPHSLTLAGHTIHWTQGGEPMSDRLN